MRIKSATGPHTRLHLGPAQWLPDSVAKQGSLGALEDFHGSPEPAVPSSIQGRGLTKDGLKIECLNWEQASLRFEDWRMLARKSVEQNIFNEPAFALSAAQHFPVASRPLFLFVSEVRGQNISGPLAAVFAIQRPYKAGSIAVRLWCPAQMAVATPLLDPEFGFAALDLLQDWFAREYPLMAGLLLPSIPDNSNFSHLLRTYTSAHALEMRQFDRRSRAILHNNSDTNERVAHWIGGKKHKELRRLWRRLSEKGDLEFMTARSPSELKSATEYFLALEAMGWKGKRGTALLCDPSLATFARTMSRRLASQVQIEIDALTLDRVPVAMAVVLRSGSEAYFWKTAYQEKLASYSPGVLLTLGMTSRLATDENLDTINSCAIPNHPMIDQLWPDRIEMVDTLIALKGRSASQFKTAAALESGKRSVRALAKTFYNKVRDMKAA